MRACVQRTQVKLNCLHPTLFPPLHDPSAREGGSETSAARIPNTFVPRHTAPLSAAASAAAAEAAASAAAAAGGDVGMADAEAEPSSSNAGRLMMAPNCLRCDNSELTEGLRGREDWESVGLGEWAPQSHTLTPSYLPPEHVLSPKPLRATPGTP